MSTKLQNQWLLEESLSKNLLADSKLGKEALRLIAKGKTGEALDFLLAPIYEGKTGNVSHQVVDDYMRKIVFLSNQFRRTETAFLEGIIQFEDYTNRINKITLSLINFIKSQNYTCS